MSPDWGFRPLMRLKINEIKIKENMWGPTLYDTYCRWDCNVSSILHTLCSYSNSTQARAYEKRASFVANNTQIAKLKRPNCRNKEKKWPNDKCDLKNFKTCLKYLNFNLILHLVVCSLDLSLGISVWGYSTSFQTFRKLQASYHLLKIVQRSTFILSVKKIS